MRILLALFFIILSSKLLAADLDQITKKIEQTQPDLKVLEVKKLPTVSITPVFLIKVFDKSKQKEIQLFAKKSSEFQKELANLGRVEVILSAKFSRRNGLLPKIARLQFALEEARLLVFEKASGKGMDEIELTPEILSDLGRRIAQMHRIDLTIISSEPENGPKVLLQGVTHGDLKLDNIFYESKNKLFTIIDYETLGYGRLESDIIQIISSILTNNPNCDAAFIFANAYTSAFEIDSDIISFLVNLYIRRALNLVHLKCVSDKLYQDFLQETLETIKEEER